MSSKLKSVNYFERGRKRFFLFCLAFSFLFYEIVYCLPKMLGALYKYDPSLSNEFEVLNINFV